MNMGIHINHCMARSNAHTYEYRPVHKPYYLHSRCPYMDMWFHTCKRISFSSIVIEEEQRNRTWLCKGWGGGGGGRKVMVWPQAFCSAMRQNSIFRSHVHSLLCVYRPLEWNLHGFSPTSFHPTLPLCLFISILCNIFSLEKEKLSHSDNCIVVSLQCGCCPLNTLFWCYTKWISINWFCVCACARNNGQLENLKTNSSNIVYCYRKWWWRQWWWILR